MSPVEMTPELREELEGLVCSWQEEASASRQEGKAIDRWYAEKLEAAAKEIRRRNEELDAIRTGGTSNDDGA